jgi:hypothetical protein
VKKELAFLLTMTLFSSGVVNGQDYDRSNFGNAPFPFWFNLTPFEIHALQNVDSAKAGDPYALLALAFVASGNVRDSLTFSQNEDRVRNFVSKIQAEIEDQNDFWQKGYILYESMWNEFFVQNNVDTLAGYNPDQSRLSEIFENGKYNCISSSILYLILARCFNINAKGILLPSHAFVQLESGDGKIIEVETTSKAGFSWVHDESFYRKKSSAWLKSRKLPKVTHKDYLNRKILEPYQLISYDMSVQHTSIERMDLIDSNRLKEMQALLWPENASFQLLRIRLYASEFTYLEENSDWRTAERLFENINPIIAGMRESFPNDADIKKGLMQLQICQNSMLLGIKDFDRFFDSTKALFDYIRSGTADSAVYYQSCLSNAFNYIKDCVDKKDFTQAEKLSNLIAPYSSHWKGLGQKLQWASVMQMTYQDSVGNWPEVIRIGKKIFESELKKKHKKAIEANIGFAYCQWAVLFYKDSNWDGALEILKQCKDDPFYLEAYLVNAFNYIKDCVDNQDFVKAEELSNLIVPYSDHREWLAQNLQWALSTQLEYQKSQGNWSEVIRISKKILESGLKKKDKKAIESYIAQAYGKWTDFFLKNDNWDRAMGILKQCNNDSIYFEPALANAFNYIKNYVENKDFANAEKFADIIVPYSSQWKWLLQNLQWALSVQLEYQWNQSNWREAIRIGKKKSTLGLAGEDESRYNKNIENAYCNWARSMEPNWCEEQNILRQCVTDSIEEKSQCSKDLKESIEKHGNCESASSSINNNE